MTKILFLVEQEIDTASPSVYNETEYIYNIFDKVTVLYSAWNSYLIKVILSQTVKREDIYYQLINYNTTQRSTTQQDSLL